jgi:dephospho-CoA kinase
VNGTQVIGLTGQTGAGKSTVSKRFAAHGAAVIDADAVAREVVSRGGKCLVALVLEFGHEILQSDGTLNRPRLGDLVFTDREKLKKLNAITHPFNMERIEAGIQACRRLAMRFVVLDAPTTV